MTYNQYLLFFEDGSGHLSFKEAAGIRLPPGGRELSKKPRKNLPGKELFLWKSGLSIWGMGGDRRQDQISMGAPLLHFYFFAFLSKKRAVHTGILPESIHKPSSFLHLISTSTAYWIKKENEKRIEGNASPPLEFTGYPFFLSMGLHPELWKNEKGIKENKKIQIEIVYKWKILIFLCSNFLIRIESFLQDLAKLLMQNDQLKKRVDTTIRLLNQLTTIKAAQVRLTISIILLLLINNHSGIKGTEVGDALNRRRGNREIFSFMYEVVCSKMYDK
ncbi:hypothetical protein ACJX0J_003057 [Zea mays]